MVILHGAAMALMIGSAIAAAACCLGAGRLAGTRAVPWQGRQSAIVMAVGMVALGAGGGDSLISLLVAAAAIGSALLGAAGTRGRGHAGACFHRALGCVAMALCAIAMLGAGEGVRTGSAGAGHAGHGDVVPFGLVAVGAVLLLVVLMAADRVRHRPAVPGGARILIDAEAGAMAVSLAVMGAMAVWGA